MFVVLTYIRKHSHKHKMRHHSTAVGLYFTKFETRDYIFP